MNGNKRTNVSVQMCTHLAAANFSQILALATSFFYWQPIFPSAIPLAESAGGESYVLEEISSG